MIERPRFVSLIRGQARCSMRLDGDRYWRDAGAWGCAVREQDGRLVVQGEPRENTSHLDGLELVAIDEKEWSEGNASYRNGKWEPLKAPTPAEGPADETPF